MKDYQKKAMSTTNLYKNHGKKKDDEQKLYDAGLTDNVKMVEEYEKIKKKESKLSSRMRDLVVSNILIGNMKDSLMKSETHSETD